MIGHTDRQTDRQPDGAIPIYPLVFIRGGGRGGGREKYIRLGHAVIMNLFVDLSIQFFLRIKKENGQKQ